MPRRPPSRWLAPFAIAAVAAAGYGVVSANRGSTSGGGPTSGGTNDSKATKRPARATSRASTGATGPRTYVVRPGDTLSSISLTTRVPLSRLNQLNPRLDAQTLQPGQRLTLRP